MKNKISKNLNLITKKIATFFSDILLLTWLKQPALALLHSISSPNKNFQRKSPIKRKKTFNDSRNLRRYKNRFHKCFQIINNNGVKFT